METNRCLNPLLTEAEEGEVAENKKVGEVGKVLTAAEDIKNVR